MASPDMMSDEFDRQSCLDDVILVVRIIAGCSLSPPTPLSAHGGFGGRGVVWGSSLEAALDLLQGPRQRGAPKTWAVSGDVTIMMCGLLVLLQWRRKKPSSTNGRRQKTPRPRDEFVMLL